MELKEMIKVMQHYLDGGEIEYRIKEPKVTIEKWLMQSTIDKEYRIIETSLVDTVINFKKVKLIESYEVEL